MTEKNKFEWEHTHIFLDELTIIAQEKIENLGDFLQQKCLVTEKLDGTNVAKDHQGIIYSKRLVIGKNLSFYAINLLGLRLKHL